MDTESLEEKYNADREIAKHHQILEEDLLAFDELMRVTTELNEAYDRLILVSIKAFKAWNA